MIDPTIRNHRTDGDRPAVDRRAGRHYHVHVHIIITPPAPTMKTERLTILVTPDQRRALAAKAKRLNLSAGEVVRRAVDSYGSDDDERVLGALADELGRSVKAARNAIREALAELGRTRAQLSGRARVQRRAA